MKKRNREKTDNVTEMIRHQFKCHEEVLVFDEGDAGDGKCWLLQHYPLFAFPRRYIQ